MGYATRSLFVEGETESSAQLGKTSNREGRQVVSKVCKLLLPFCFQICGDSSLTNVLDEERCGDALGSSSIVGVLAVKRHLM